METFKMPMRQVRQTYKRSEIAMMSWRSRETAFKLQSRMQENRPQNPSDANNTYIPEQTVRGVKDTGTAYVLPEDVNNGVPIPKTFFNANGDVDLTQVKGKDAVNYLNALGLNIPNLAFLSDI